MYNLSCGARANDNKVAIVVGLNWVDPTLKQIIPTPIINASVIKDYSRMKN